MALDYDMLMGLAPFTAQQNYDARDTMLYALGLGVGQAAVDNAAHLRFVYEKDLQALPTMAGVLAYPGMWVTQPQYGIDWRKVLHAEQSTELLKPLPSSGSVRSETKIDAIHDKGAAKGALLYQTRTVFDAHSGEVIARIRQGLFLRGNGGFSGVSGDKSGSHSSGAAPVPHATPERTAEIIFSVPTRPEQALLYRLSGDVNPLHADPEVARSVGFDKPILHGMATYGIAAWAALTAFCEGDSRRLKRFDARFSSPVFPGEKLRVEMWREGRGRAALQVRVSGREEIVLKNGWVEFED